MIESLRNPEPLHICHVITGLDTGGAESALYRLLRNFDRNQFRMSVVSLTEAGTVGPKIADLGIPVECLGMRAGALPLKGVLSLRRHLQQAAPDVIQSWMYHANLLALTVSRLSRSPVPVIWNIRHSLDNLDDEKTATRLVIRACRFLSGLAAGIVYNSNRSRLQHEQLGYRDTCSRVIANGFEQQDTTQHMSIRSQIRQSLDIPLNAPVVGRIGRYHEMKDYGTFLQAAAILRRSQPEAHVLLCGRGIDLDNPELRSMLDGQAGSNVHLLGERSDVPNILAAIDIMCSSSAFGEGFPNILGEAMAAGVPCVTTDVGDSAEIVGDTGLVTPPRDASALAGALDTLLSMSPDQRAELGQSATERVDEYYSLAASTQAYQSLYRSVTEAR